jgi:hypothetical protein
MSRLRPSIEDEDAQHTSSRHLDANTVNDSIEYYMMMAK